MKNWTMVICSRAQKVELHRALGFASELYLTRAHLIIL